MKREFIDLGDGSWWDLKRAARILWRSGRHGRLSVMDHAKVARDNRHKCTECFLCACAHIWHEEKRNPIDYRR
jgi:hypothetical protein